jgi:hypothetical protein
VQQRDGGHSGGWRGLPRLLKQGDVPACRGCKYCDLHCRDLIGPPCDGCETKACKGLACHSHAIGFDDRKDGLKVVLGRDPARVCQKQARVFIRNWDHKTCAGWGLVCLAIGKRSQMVA